MRTSSTAMLEGIADIPLMKETRVVGRMTTRTMVGISLEALSP
jgi:hypothetical protein